MNQPGITIVPLSIRFIYEEITMNKLLAALIAGAFAFTSAAVVAQTKDAPKAEAKKDAPKADAKKDAPKADAKKDAPKADAKKDAKK